MEIGNSILMTYSGTRIMAHKRLRRVQRWGARRAAAGSTAELCAIIGEVAIPWFSRPKLRVPNADSEKNRRLICDAGVGLRYRDVPKLLAFHDFHTLPPLWRGASASLAGGVWMAPWATLKACYKPKPSPLGGQLDPDLEPASYCALESMDRLP